MSDIKQEQKNFRNDARLSLKLANKEWIDCISNKFMN